MYVWGALPVRAARMRQAARARHNPFFQSRSMIMSSGGGGTGGPEHPNTLSPCTGAKLSLDADAFNSKDPTVRTTALLLAGQAFLESANDPRIALAVRAALQEKAYALIKSAAELSK
jgi:hypothetical protein